MTKLVILAAGKGTRMGRVGHSLHKCLAPLEGRAIISHIIDARPADAPVIICTGYRAAQVEEYVTLAHSDLADRVVFVPVTGWDEPGGGPGASLLTARDYVGDDDMIFTSCDTLWRRDDALWDAQRSWVAVAPVPVGTNVERWCRIATHGSLTGGTETSSSAVWRIIDKIDDPIDAYAYTGLSFVVKGDLDLFWNGLALNQVRQAEGEHQVTGGLDVLVRNDRLDARRVEWTDVGDETAYLRAVAERTGYDWTKTDEATYVLPRHGRVVKYWAEKQTMGDRALRGWALGGAVPRLIDHSETMLAYEFVRGSTCYEHVESGGHMTDLLTEVLGWAQSSIWLERAPSRTDMIDACDRFYRLKTYDRIRVIHDAQLRTLARDAVRRVDWDELVKRCEPVSFHGDFNFGNIIRRHEGHGYVGIDWRQDFAGHTGWGDRRYDLAKLLAGFHVNWDRARRGDFRPWEHADFFVDRLHEALDGIPHDVQVIAALSLINTAPLHAAPLDEVLVMRAISMLEELT